MEPEPALTEPAISRVGVLALVPDLWDDFWQSRHHVMSRLTRYFRVLWVEPPEAQRRFRAMSRWRHASASDGSDPLAVYQPDTWLRGARPTRWLAKLVRCRRFREARAILRRQGCEKIVLYLWRPSFLDALDCVGADVSCYHVDDEYSWSSTEVPIGPEEVALLARVDQVFIHSPALLEKKGHLNPRTAWVPNGVDYDAFASSLPEPAILASVPRPRIGYAGMIKKQLDFALLIALARRHPAWSFILVGRQNHHPDIETPVAELASLPNVHLLGSTPTVTLPSFAQHFDVCVMPYVLNDYTRYIYPLKLHEYLASGRPTVGTPIRSLADYAEVVALARTVDEWSDAIAEALKEEASSARREARQAVARLYDWNLLVARIAAAIGECLGPEIAAAVAAASPAPAVLSPDARALS